ncbi:MULTISPECIES: nucleoside recognition domain-containing protein [Acutalibacteraceae]|uniref:nucleoside recognition domain-containing protein n=1 Tax=Acutalibacteraceae TaxID=3082771 RepID=UPI001FA948EE|nr:MULTISPECIES: nucleoside recognition domain-containing protein [Acutalibacteraceae]
MNKLLNYIWAGMILFSVICAVITGRMEQLSGAVLSGASDAVTLVLTMTGMMCAWTGLMKIADEGGLTALLSKALNPIMRLLFPDCKPGGPAVKAMCMNITANLLGLGNAATPLGIAAMKELKKNNPTQTADNSMATFVVLNTASIQLIPTFLGTMRAQYGSAAPFDILPAVWITSVCSVIVGLTAAKLMEGFSGG